jgi:hypothetical protein
MKKTNELIGKYRETLFKKYIEVELYTQAEI